MSKRTKSSRKWLKEHFNDPYVQKAKLAGYRSRAAFKLIEILNKDKLVKPNDIVVDLGAAPGGWSQILAKNVGKNGKVFALDRLKFESIAGVEIIVADFTEDLGLSLLQSKLKGETVNAIFSDMAPNTSGISVSDQANMMYLAELALDFALSHLDKKGTFTVKIFQGEGFDAYYKNMQAHFKKVVSRKPLASRTRSKEIYLIGKEFK
jgi:23S rRNA (uridine2552-2'-O)-methyltransferase